MRVEPPRAAELSQPLVEVHGPGPGELRQPLGLFPQPDLSHAPVDGVRPQEVVLALGDPCDDVEAGIAERLDDRLG